MRISVELELKDVPGQLVKALEPISTLGGNIVSVVHLREEKRTGTRVPVHVIFDVVDSDSRNVILEELRRRDIWVSKVDEAKKKDRFAVVLIGHIVDTDMRDTIDKINAVKGALVAEVNVEMPHPDHESSAVMTLEVCDARARESVMAKLDELGGEKGLLIVKPLEV